MDIEQDVVGDQTPERPHFLGEEIARPDNIHVRLDELLPG